MVTLQGTPAQDTQGQDKTQNLTVAAREDREQHMDRDHFSLALRHLTFMRADTTFERWRRKSSGERRQPP